MESDFSDFKVAVIGLGLIGGSMAYALRGFRKGTVVGCDIDPKVRAQAVKERAVSLAYADPGDAIDGADLVIFCTYPKTILELVEKHRHRLKSGAVVSDVCGIKTTLAREIVSLLPEGVDYVGGHPMAGKEVEGFANASAELFWMTGFIVTPAENAKAESVALVCEMAQYIGATRITQASPEEHDSVIAYTSDLMHVAAAGLCLDYHPDMNRAYTAGSFRDCTRIANINPELWTELFLSNKENTLKEIDRYLSSLNRLREAIAGEDSRGLRELLAQVRENKKTMQEKEPQPWDAEKNR
ncbi:MAG: prephenate dehydrogenase [Clostridia bacterium]|nr:prephenate dehydrogenase [Clostridia bacterium]